MRHNLFGQYKYESTLIHRLDPRIKMALVFCISLSLFYIKGYISFIAVSILIFLIAAISKIKLKNMLLNLRPFLFFFVFILLMYALFSRDELAQGIIVVWRFVLLVILSSILTFSTSTSQMVYAIEKLFAPLRIIRINSRDLALMASATIRFIPVLFLEANNVMDAQRSRGANIKKIRNIRLLMASLLRKTFNRASNLADAIESRCYRNFGNSNFRELKLSAADYASVLFIALFVGGALWIQI